jgi:diadenosine tetraphosphatase ApaH/serine/threonine PP2A family protein phosphatase
VIAILSDIHGNLEALSAVLSDLEQQGVQAVYYLGGTLGYGPNPVECLDRAMGFTVGLLGNFDQAVLVHPDGFCKAAEASILWSRSQLDAQRDTPAGQKRAEYLATLARSHCDGDVLYVHGSARNPLNEYVFPEDVHNPSKMERIGAAFDRLSFCGHTHVPGVFLERGLGKWEFIHAEECERGFPVAGCKLICNVGAVGQPRDHDERACYALFDGERIWLKRVAYDVETTICKICSVPELDDFLGFRLREGR